MNHKSDIKVQCDIEPHIGRRLEDVERELIMGTLARCGGNRTWASEILGISVRTLRNKMIQYDAASEIPPKMGRGNRDKDKDLLAVLEKFEPGRLLPS